MTEISIPSLKEFIPDLRSKSNGDLTVDEILNIINKVDLGLEYEVTEGFKFDSTQYLILTGRAKKQIIIVFDSMFTTIQFLDDNKVTKTLMKVEENVF